MKYSTPTNYIITDIDEQEHIYNDEQLESKRP